MIWQMEVANAILYPPESYVGNRGIYHSLADNYVQVMIDWCDMDCDLLYRPVFFGRIIYEDGSIWSHTLFFDKDRLVVQSNLDAFTDFLALLIILFTVIILVIWSVY